MILLKILSIYLKEQNYDVSEVHYMATPVVRSALEQGQIDVYWEYTGTALRLFYNHQAEANPQVAYQLISQLDHDKGLIWLNMTPANSTYSILMRRDKADHLGIKSISDLADYIQREKPDFLFASSAEFHTRVDGLSGLQQKYGFTFRESKTRRMEPSCCIMLYVKTSSMLWPALPLMVVSITTIYLNWTMIWSFFQLITVCRLFVSNCSSRTQN